VPLADLRVLVSNSLGPRAETALHEGATVPSGYSPLPTAVCLSPWADREGIGECERDALPLVKYLGNLPIGGCIPVYGNRYLQKRAIRIVDPPLRR